MSELRETGQKLRDGISQVRDSMGSLKDGRAHAESIIRDLHGKRFAVNAMIDFFRALQDRVEREVATPYRAAQQDCTEGTAMIAAVLQGAENPLANNVREASGALRSQSADLLDGINQMKHKDDIDVVIGALDTARAYIQSITDAMISVEQVGDDTLREAYPAVLQNAMRYSENL